MVAIVAGSGLGLFNSTVNQENGAGVLGNNQIGQAKGASYVNLATGNLILQFNDETLSGRGADIRHLRTYNSQGGITDGDSDRWRWLGEKRIRLVGTLNTSGSKVYRTTGDGHKAVYSWNGAVYISAEGAGADDRIVRSSTEWIWTEGTSKTVERYNGSTGWIKNLRDQSGNGFNYTFNSDRLTRITDIGSGQTLDLIYNSGRLTRVDTRPSTSGSATRQVYYSYDNSGRLSSVKTDLTLNNSISDNNVYTTSYTYDGSSTRVKNITQGDGSSVNFTYVNVGSIYKVATVVDQMGTTEFAYHVGRTDVTNGEGKITRYYHDSQQRLTRVDSASVNDMVQSVKYAYDSKDNVTKVTDGKGNAITYTYDSRSNLIKEVDALDNTIERIYNNDRLVNETRIVDGQAQTKRYVYDTKGRVRYTISAEGHVAENRYHANGLLVGSIQYTQDAYNVSALSKTAQLSESQLNSWAAGRNKTQTQLTQYHYDNRGNLTQKIMYGTVNSAGNGVTNANTARTDYVYSVYGELLQTIAVTGNARDVRTTLESRGYDGMGRLLSVVNEGGTTTTTYASSKITVNNTASGLTLLSKFDGRGKLVNVTQTGNSQNRITRHYYDKAGRLLMTQDAGGGHSYNFYDNAGRVSYTVSALGEVTSFIYDANGQLTKTRRFHNKVNISSWFNGSAVTVTGVSINTHENDRITRNNYDKAGRLITTTQEFGNSDLVTATVYDSASQVVSTTVGGDRTTHYYYDKDGRVIGTLNAENYFVENVYDRAGRLSAVVRYGKKSTVTTTFSAIRNNVDDGNIQTSHYFYDSAGRQVGVLNEQGYLTETVYDVANRKTLTRTYTKPLDALTFRNQTGVNYDSHTGDLKKSIAGNHWGDSGVESENVLAADVDGWVQFTASETNTYRMLGLNKTSDGVNSHFNTIDYALYARADGYVHVYENGAHKGKFTPYNTGDILRIERVGSTLYYKKNGTTFYTSTVKTAGALRLDASINSTNGTIKNIEGSFFSVGARSNSQAEMNRIKGLIGNAKNTTTTLFDVRGRVKKVITQDGTQTRNVYDSAGRLTRTISAESSEDQTASRMRYNAFGEVTGVVSGVGEAAQSNLTTAIDQYGTEYKYDAMGRKIYEEGPQGQKTFYYYNKGNQLTYIVNALGEVSHTSYNSFGQVTTIRTLSKRINLSGLTGGNENTTIINRVNTAKDNAQDYEVSTFYNQLGLVSRKLDGEGKESTYQYDKYGDLRNIYTPFGEGAKVRQHLIYDGLGRVTHSYADFNGIKARTRTYYNGFDQVTRITDANGENVNTDFHENGRRIVVRDGLNRSTSTRYDVFGRELEVVDAAGQISTYTYDDTSRTVVVKTPENIQLKTWKTRRGQVLQMRDGNGHLTKYTYDKDGNVKTVTDALGNVTTNRYDKSGRLYETKDANNNLVRFSYDEVNRVIQRSVDPDGLNLRTHYTFDGQGRTIETREGFGTGAERRTQFIYDRNGRLKQEIIDPGGLKLSTRYSYDDAGNQVKVERGTTDSPVQQTVQYIYDKLGRKTQEVLNPGKLNITTQYRYDKNGNLTRVIDANNQSTWFIYNAANERTHQINALGYVTGYEYNANGQISQTREYVNKISTTDWSNIPTNVSVSAHAADRRTYTVYDDNQRKRFSVTASNSNSWVVTESILDKNGNTVESRRYDRALSNGDVGGVINAGSSAKHVITEAEMISVLRSRGYRDTRWGDTSMALFSTRRTHFSYDKNNRLRFTVDPLGYVTEMQYDGIGQVRYQIQYANKPNDLENNYSHHHINSKLNKSTGLDRTKEYRYDRAGRVIQELSSSATVTATNGVTYTGKIKNRSFYDALGQVIKREEGVIERSGASDVTVDRRSTTFNYDKAGRQIKTTLAGWYDSTDMRTYQHKQGQSDRFQRTVEVKYDALGNAVRNKIRIGISEYQYQYKAYDAIGRVLFDVDAEGFVSGKTYDKLGNTKTETRFHSNLSNAYGAPGRGYWFASEISARIGSDSSRRLITHIYDVLGRKTKTLLPTVKNYISSGSASAVNPDKATTYKASPETRLEYNSFGDVVKKRVRLDSRRWSDMYMYYDRLGRQTFSVDAERYGTKTDYDALGNMIRVTEYAKKTYGSPTISAKPIFISNSKDRIKTFNYDSKGQGVSTYQQNAMYFTKQQYGGWASVKGSILLDKKEYNAFGDVTKASDSLNNVTHYNYNGLGLVTKAIAPKRKVASTATNPFNSQVSVSPTTTYKYSTFGLIVSETYSAGAGRGESITTSSVYDHTGNQIRSTDGDGFHTHYKMDANGRVIRQTQSVSTASEKTSLSYSHTIERRFEYDKVGRQTATLDVYENSQTGMRQIYNGFGEVIRAEKLWGDKNTATERLAKLATASYAYDKAGRISSERNKDGYAYYFYDLQGHLTRVEQRGHNNANTGARVTENYYDLQGRKLVQRQPHYSGTNTSLEVVTLRPSISHNYDRWGNVTRLVGPANSVTTYAYNYLDKLVSETGAVTSVYKKHSSSPYHAKVSRLLDYDKRGSLIRETFEAKNTSNNVIEDKKVKYQYYDEAGQVVETVDATGKRQYFAYDIHGNRVATKNGVGTVHVFNFNNRGLVTKQSVVRSGNLVRLHEMVYDQAGRKYSEYNEAGNRESYRFDERGNIVYKIGLSNKHTRFTFDQFGHKTAEERKARISFEERYKSSQYGHTPTYSYRTVHRDVWLGDKYIYRLSDYNLDQLERRSYVTHVGEQGSVRRANVDYTYTRFAQLAKESVVGKSASINYSYWRNGLLRAKSDLETVSDKQRRVKSEYHYDARGYRTIETHTNTDSTARLSFDETFTANVSHTMRNEFKYDALGRLIEIKSPGKSVKTNDGTKTSTDIDLLKYHYDAWDNRRQISATYFLPGSTSKKYKVETFFYDAEGRLTRELISNGAKTFTYDGAGRRVTEDIKTTETIEVYDQSYGGYVPKDKVNHSRKIYSYNDRGQITQVKRNTDVVNSGQYKVIESNTYDSRGFKTQSVVNYRKTITTYYNDGRILEQYKYNNAGKVDTRLHSYKFTLDGNIQSYKFQKYGDDGFTSTYNYSYKSFYNGSQVSRILVSSSQGGTKAGETYNFYDYFGRLVHSKILEPNSAGKKTGFSEKYFTYNADNQVMASVYRQFERSYSKMQNIYTINGESLADIGDERVDITPLNSFSKGGDTPGSYTVNTGDTLSRIAQITFGDASLWYVIAEANSLNMGPAQSFSASDAGRSLSIPNTAQSVKNNASTFKPYNPSDAIGDLTPSPEIIPPPKKNKCKTILAIVVVAVVGIAATIITTGAAALLFGAAQGSIFTAGLTTLTSSLTLGGIAAAGIGGFVGSLASQQVGKWMGVQEKVDLKQALASGLTSAFSAGIGDVLNGGQTIKQLVEAGRYGNIVASSAANYAASYVSHRIAGTGTEFTWKKFVISVGSSVATAGINQSLGLTTDNFLENFASGFVGSATNYGVNALFNDLDGGRFQWAEMLADSFGNALGNAVIEKALGGPFFGPKNNKASKRQEVIEKYQALRQLSHKAKEAGIDTPSEALIYSKVKESLGRRLDKVDQEKIDDFAVRAFTLSENFTDEGFIAYQRDVYAASGIAQADVDAMMALTNGRAAEVGQAISGDEATASAFSASQGILLDEVVVNGRRLANRQGERTPLGDLLYGASDALASVGDAAVKVGEFIEKNWWAKYGLMAVEIAAGPLAFVARQAVMASPVGDALNSVSEYAMTKATEFVDSEAQLGNLNKSAKVVVGGMATASLVIGGVSFFRKMIPKAGKFLRNHKLTLDRNTLSMNGLGGVKVVKKAGSSHDGHIVKSKIQPKKAIFFKEAVEFIAPRKGTGIKYKVFQQDIDPNMEVTIKSSIFSKSKTMTNLDLMKNGKAPYVMKDGKLSRVDLHHSRQDAKGTLFEVSTKTHNSKTGHGSEALHPFKTKRGRAINGDGSGVLKSKHPVNQVNRVLFAKDRKAYWMLRANGF